LTSRELPLEEIFYGVVWEHIVKGPDFFLLSSYVAPLPLFGQRCTGSSVAAPQTEEKERAKEGAITIIEQEGLLEQIKTTAKNVDLLLFNPFLGHSINKSRFVLYFIPWKIYP
jgi:hypothetical protein